MQRVAIAGRQGIIQRVRDMLISVRDARRNVAVVTRLLLCVRLCSCRNERARAAENKTPCLEARHPGTLIAYGICFVHALVCMVGGRRALGKGRSLLEYACCVEQSLLKCKALDSMAWHGIAWHGGTGGD